MGMGKSGSVMPFRVSACPLVWPPLRRGLFRVPRLLYAPLLAPSAVVSVRSFALGSSLPYVLCA
eukprot:scaffold23151_cov35-Tisochrysis_lutea.AAC.1